MSDEIKRLADEYVRLKSVHEDAIDWNDDQRAASVLPLLEAARAEFHAAIDRNAEAMEVLRELVELQDMKDRADKINPVAPGYEKQILREEYSRRLPTAWAAARKVTNV